MAGSNPVRTDTRGGRQITEEKVLPLVCHLQKDKEKNRFLYMAAALCSHENCGTFFIVHDIYRTTGKNV